MMMKMQLFIVLGLVLIGIMVEVGKGAPGEQPEDPNHQTQPGTLKTLRIVNIALQINCCNKRPLHRKGDKYTIIKILAFANGAVKL